MISTRRLLRLRVPDLTPDQAVALVEVFEAMIAKIWQVHGDQMHDYLDRAGIPYSPPAGACSVPYPRLDDDAVL